MERNPSKSTDAFYGQTVREVDLRPKRKLQNAATRCETEGTCLEYLEHSSIRYLRI